MSVLPTGYFYHGAALVAFGGLVVGAYFHFRFPWEEMNRRGEIRLAGRTLAVTRYGVTAASAAFVPISVGMTTVYAAPSCCAGAHVDVAVSSEATLSVAERVLAALPGDLLFLLGGVTAFLGVVVPLPLVAHDVATTLLRRHRGR